MSYLSYMAQANCTSLTQIINLYFPNQQMQIIKTCHLNTNSTHKKKQENMKETEQPDNR